MILSSTNPEDVISSNQMANIIDERKRSIQGRAAS
jgi:hypothetical protein